MKDEKEGKRVMVFIDGSSLYHILKALVQNRKPTDLNFEKFIKHLAENRHLIRTYYYNAPLDLTKDLKSYMKQQRFFNKLKRISNFELVLCSSFVEGRDL